MGHTVDAWNPAPVDMVNTQYLQGFIHARWCRISSINSIEWSLKLQWLQWLHMSNLCFLPSLACQQDVACNGLLLWFEYTTQVVESHRFQHPQHVSTCLTYLDVPGSWEMVRINGLFHLLVNGIYIYIYIGVITHLLTIYQLPGTSK